MITPNHNDPLTPRQFGTPNLSKANPAIHVPASSSIAGFETFVPLCGGSSQPAPTGACATGFAFVGAPFLSPIECCEPLISSLNRPAACASSLAAGRACDCVFDSAAMRAVEGAKDFRNTSLKARFK